MVSIRHCFYCGKKLSRRKATKDHVIPKSRGGSDSRRNVVDACRSCNRDKGCLSINEFRVVMAFRKGYLKAPRSFKFPGELIFD